MIAEVVPRSSILLNLFGRCQNFWLIMSMTGFKYFCQGNFCSNAFFGLLSTEFGKLGINGLNQK